MDLVNESQLLRYSICCTNLPEALLNKVAAKKHFAQFGKIASMYVRPQQMSCTIDYVDKDSAEDAIEYAGEYDGMLFDVNWAPTKKTRPKVIDPDWLPDPEVQAEIEALQGLTPAATPRLTRQKPMIIDLTQDEPVIKKPPKNQLFKAKKISVKPQKNTEDTKTSIKSANIDHLKDILTTPALTIEQKYRTLDARDQLIRIQNDNEATVKSDHIKGTCPDMCPEKERLMREYQHQIAQYEQNPLDPRTMNHCAAVKQYSRSSADQEIPLPHDLRPVQVLERTMSYLLLKIADLSEEENVNLNDWYHFFWDRTRSIRKDITQQGMCCKGSVKLVEQCARFHIHCAARLADEDASVFDQRINTENLTKCLQSLKYMYHDLEQKGEICDNEAEFRAYIILLNLNDCNFMWEVQQWSSDIQKSPQVQFAIKVFLAVDNNNYVKFFKLVRETTYMNSCILLRYFNQVRTKAITIIVKSFVARIPTSYSLSGMTDILAFENIEQCVQFIENYGLSCNISEDTIQLDKQLFSEPNFAPQLCRCLNVIESKRTSTIGEAIYGSSIPEINFPKFVPHNSFDEQGYLKDDALSASDQVESKNKTSTFSALPVFESNVFKTINPAPDVENPLISNKNTNMSEKSNNIFGKINFSKPDNSNKTPDNIFGKQLTTSITPSNLFETNTTVFAKSATTTSSIFTPPSSTFQTQSVIPNNVFQQNQKTTVPSASENIYSQAVDNQQLNNVFIQTIPKANDASKSIFTSELSTPNTSNSNVSFKTLITNSPTTSNNFTFNLQSKPSTMISANLEKQKEKEKLEEMKAKEREIEKQKEQERIEKEKQIENEKRKQIAIENCTKESLKLFEGLLEEEIGDVCRSQATSELRRYNIICDTAVELAEQYIVDTIKIMLREEILSELRVFRTIQNIQTRSQERLAGKYYYLWLQNVLIRKFKRKAIEETPVWISSRSVDEEAALLYRENQKSALENILNYKNLSVENAFDDEPIQRINRSFELCRNIFSATKFARPRSKAYWKLVISIPDEIEGSYWSKYLHKWVDCAFSETDNTTGTNQLHLNEYFDKTNGTSTAISYKKSVGCCDNVEDLLGMNSLIFFTFSDSFYQKRMKERLMNILKHRTKPMFSIVIVCIKVKLEASCNVEDFISFLRDIRFEGQYVITIANDYKYDTLHNSSTIAMEWLSKRRAPDSPLQMDSLEVFIYSCLGSELIQKLAFASRNNYVLRKLFRDPNFIIELYNCAVGKCLDMVSEEALQVYEDFAPELRQFLPEPLTTSLSYEYFPKDWRNVKQQCRIRSIIKNFELPYFDDLKMVQNVEELNAFLVKYCTKMLSGSEQVDTLASKMYCVALTSLGKSQNSQLQSTKISWVDMIDILVRELVTERLGRILRKDPDMYIIYNHNLFIKYLNDPWWLKSKQFILENRANQDNFKVVEEEYEDFSNNKRQKLNSNICTIDKISESIARAWDTIENFDKAFDKNKTTVKKELIHKYEKLNLTVEEQASKFQAFNKILEKTLNNF